MAKTDREVERRLDELYRGAPKEFTSARDRLAAELKAAVGAEAAANVKRLKRPTQAASVVNRLSLDHPNETKALLDAGDRLRNIQSRLGAAGAGERLREAVRGEREAFERLLELARQMEPRPSATTLERVDETLRAAGADEEVAGLVRTGRLDRERRAFGVGPTPARSRAHTKPTEDRSRELKEARATLANLRRRENRARTQRERALQRRADAQSELEDARARLSESESELASIEGEIAERERELRRLER
jgi:hypothetical protein